jgi:hypothetical protein
MVLEPSDEDSLNDDILGAGGNGVFAPPMVLVGIP